MTYSFAYDRAGRISARGFSNRAYAYNGHPASAGTTDTEWCFNGLNQITGEDPATAGDCTTTQINQPVYNARGNLTENGHGRVFQYDEYNQLIATGTNGFDTTWTDIVDSPDEIYNYDPYGRLYEITAGSDSTFFEYDTRSGPGTGAQSVAAEYSGYNATLTYGDMTHRYACPQLD